MPGFRKVLNLLKTSRGVALFMVLSAIAVLSLLVSEFTYISQLSQRMAYDRLDQLTALYSAKSGLKLSLLRLKAYQHAKNALGKMTGGAPGAAGIGPGMLDQIWSFPLIYPLPTDLPGLTPSQKDAFEKFRQESGLKGEFTAAIESESSKYNLNLLLGSLSPQPKQTKDPPKGKIPTASAGGKQPDDDPQGSAPEEEEKFDPEAARKSLYDYLLQILTFKFEEDEDFASEYRNLRLEDVTENIFAWVYKNYESRSTIPFDEIPPKRAPFYSITELHMIPGLDDDLYELFAPNLTVSATPGININTMGETVLRALLPDLTDEEVMEFFKYRDDPQEGTKFPDVEAFYSYLEQSTSSMNTPEVIQEFKEGLGKRNITLLTEESSFLITVRATRNLATKTIRAAVTLSEPAIAPPQGGNSQGGSTEDPASPGGGIPRLSGPGPRGRGMETNLKITAFSLE